MAQAAWIWGTHKLPYVAQKSSGLYNVWFRGGQEPDKALAELGIDPDVGLPDEAAVERALLYHGPNVLPTLSDMKTSIRIRREYAASPYGGIREHLLTLDPSAKEKIEKVEADLELIKTLTYDIGTDEKKANLLRLLADAHIAKSWSLAKPACAVSRPPVTVLRAGTKVELAVQELLPGDIICNLEGEVPADVLILSLPSPEITVKQFHDLSDRFEQQTKYSPEKPPAEIPPPICGIAKNPFLLTQTSTIGEGSTVTKALVLATGFGTLKCYCDVMCPVEEKAEKGGCVVM
eukprot:TRINITY_DN25343_c0_g1_i4.p1 TRINITY_DN25343_c0_g1~~TRINITY_DN25343_c0_g1_i4.p1  ORF type:complete len:291 (+),score=47.72 TRINITY_DN25343_c0_g1_i4:176-1048(+)